jgi:hypothetical protein
MAWQLPQVSACVASASRPDVETARITVWQLEQGRSRDP